MRYNPKPGYKSLDCNSYCDHHSLDELDDCSVDKFHIRNTLHHIEDIDGFVVKLKSKLKEGGEIEVIDCSKEYFKQNLCLDNLWYRYIFNRPDIFIQQEFIDYSKLFDAAGLKIVEHFENKEKLTLIFNKS